MTDLSQYANDMSYLKQKAREGTLTSDDAIYQKLKGKSNLKELVAWLAKEIDPYVKHI